MDNQKDIYANVPCTMLSKSLILNTDTIYIHD